MIDLPQMIVVNHINTHRKPECNSDLVLYADHLLKCYHINQHGVALGLEAFAPDFNYNHLGASPATDVASDLQASTVSAPLPPSSGPPSAGHLDASVARDSSSNVDPPDSTAADPPSFVTIDTIGSFGSDDHVIRDGNHNVIAHNISSSVASTISVSSGNYTDDYSSANVDTTASSVGAQTPALVQAVSTGRPVRNQGKRPNFALLADPWKASNNAKSKGKSNSPKSKSKGKKKSKRSRKKPKGRAPNTPPHPLLT